MQQYLANGLAHQRMIVGKQGFHRGDPGIAAASVGFGRFAQVRYLPRTLLKPSSMAFWM
jgi:hypothetical protein